eukprot:CAMPEP_0182494234 /NCGR_PEP_ID=MMETSP1321-20130603/3125_1 /TAXON_ID=91990 /ORGANISM="Bolidomonas sp., Strain RCC1657" /LENGTH=94 /DNA_ID=CAMNT_0024697253 /DNA_START=33 /DNA_END=313 /DNA_ORIENTATION=+
MEASSVMYFPEGQLVQLPEPGVSLYFPAEHITQDTLPCSEKVPASQSKQSSSKDPGDELYFPASHEVQTEDPSGENLPAEQTVQASPSPLYVPT